MMKKIKRRSVQCCAVLLSGLMFGSCAMINETSHETAASSTIKVLFLGNSYTDQIQRVFKQIVADSSHKDSKIQVIWGGGATLKRLIDKGRASKWIQAEEWDYVVLQEQSLTPALPAGPRNSFHDSVDTLVTEIRGIGAEPILYMTWGRRDIDERHKEQFVDYDTMQQKLSDAYRAAAKRNKIQVAPVGDAWSQVRKKDAALGRELYAKDGSHPSTNGAFLASCVFFRVLFNDSLEQVQAPEGMSQQDAMLIMEVVAGMTLPEEI